MALHSLWSPGHLPCGHLAVKHPLIQEVVVIAEPGGNQTLNVYRDIKCNILEDCLNNLYSQLQSSSKNNTKCFRLQEKRKSKRTIVLDSASGLRWPRPSSLTYGSDHRNLRTNLRDLRVKITWIFLNQLLV